ncbi:hypothetical protein NNJEOMEG_03528 [Fundidesulfovibrio magnetotacticus]|uniref:Uncharacterized protein n=1 Tax=Fundidesulfovibrio magnetotacticus TaxID=2730080 RepID=A0A6V8LXQ3_9BACT|nr:hypothetical protein [Fundidesulfovibrio magnetotacticus]GFK95660.1 hypothetical protein NNJEOMEG_03528 [Fundidesulfovibrio magnetotacticus]
MKPEEKVVSMDEFRKPKENEVPSLAELNAKTSQDISRMSLILALVAVLLAGVLFFKSNQSVNVLTKDVAGISAKVGVMDARMAELENLPAKSKRMVMGTLIMEMAQKASYLSTQVDNPEQAAKLLQAMELLQQAKPE